MTQEIRRASLMGVSTSAMLIALAIAILAAYVANNWWLLFPILVLEFGIYTVAVGAILRGRPGETFAGTSDSTFTMMWGMVLTVIGAMLLIDYVSPGNLPLLIAAFLVIMGVALLVISLGRIRKK
ncbi:MAG: hypothetical protein OEV21_05760 [Thermoplasmata archaeon]|nr:hypothetical protein [Thermoplasmata archaeon]